MDNRSCNNCSYNFTYLFKKSSKAQKELTREGLTKFAEENNLKVNKGFIDLTSEFQLADIPYERSAEFSSPFFPNF